MHYISFTQKILLIWELKLENILCESLDKVSLLKICDFDLGSEVKHNSACAPVTRGGASVLGAKVWGRVIVSDPPPDMPSPAACWKTTRKEEEVATRTPVLTGTAIMGACMRVCAQVLFFLAQGVNCPCYASANHYFWVDHSMWFCRVHGPWGGGGFHRRNHFLWQASWSVELSVWFCTSCWVVVLFS